MSDYSVFKDVSETMKHLLEENLQPLVSPENIVFASPADIDTESNAPHTLSLFLFKVEENPHLKNREMQNIDHTIIQPPPITLDLLYLITPFANDRAQEILIIGKVMQIFYDHAILKGRYLRDGLEGAREEFRVSLYSLPFEENFQLWQSFTEKSFRLSICYKVTPVEIDSTRMTKAKRSRKSSKDFETAI